MDKILYVRNFKKDLIAGYFVDAFNAMMQISNHLQSDFIPKDEEHSDYLFNLVATFISVGELMWRKEEVIEQIVNEYKHPYKELVNIRNFIFGNFLKIININNEDDGMDIYFYRMKNCSIDMRANKRAGKFETTVFLEGGDDAPLLSKAQLAFGCILTGMEINPARILRCERANCIKFFYSGKPGRNWKFKRRFCSTKCGNAQRMRNWKLRQATNSI